MSLPRQFSLALGCWLVACVAAAPAGQPERLQFNRDIRPILSENCFQCHGPDEQERHAGLRLDVRDSAVGELDSGVTAIVPGDVAASALLERITSTDDDLRMPPPATGKRLAPEQMDTLRRWIAEGAEYEGHWAFLAPVRPEPPEVRHAAAVRNPIDRFILARLEKEGLAPSPEANKETLIRRATFDLTGLPPTPAEIDAFLADTAPDAYERLIDRLLKSPRYGEHMARHWLDLARYGDTHGLHLDNERSLWKYRDWVIDAFNQNKRFDVFTIEQLAGDLLPNPTLDQRIATGFNRCNVTTSEGGSINDEVLVRYAVDRTETMATVFMGLTLGCAVCHDHKFDPVSQKEFYQLYAFFNAAADAAMDGNQLAPPPIVKAPSRAQETQLADLERQLAATQERLRNELSRVEYVDPEPEATGAPEPREIVWIDDATPEGANLQGNTPWEWVSTPEHPVFSGQRATRRTADNAVSQHFFTGAKPTLNIGEGDKLFAYVYLDPQNPPKTVMLQFNDGAWEHRAFWGEDAIPFGGGDTPGHRRLGDLPPLGQWTRLEVDAAHVGLSAGAELNGWAFTQFGGTVYWDQAGLLTRTPQDGFRWTSLARWEAFERSIEKSSTPGPVRAALKVERAQRNEQQTKLIREHFLEHVCEQTRPVFEPLQQQIARLNSEKTELDKAIPVSMVMADLPKPRDTFVLIRGEYDKRADKVEAGTPAVFPPLPAEAPLNRLGLAQWLTSPDHPLTARVSVNRYWQQVFGRGIVKTTEDFGSQGDWPSHPELLDWLAVEFVESGWDVQQLLRLILTSATYRQSSHVTPESFARDPENVLLARGVRHRIDAEMVRDNALYLSGLLVEQVGGKSVKPYQPPGIWEAVGFVGSNTREFKRDSGEALYRRSLYTFWKRTAPPPSLMAFDAPSRETCTSRRARTNTPLQALVLLNDEQYVEAARKFAARLIEQGGATPEARLTYGFRWATSRLPQTDEVAVLLRVFEAQQAHFAEHPDEARKLLAIGEAPRPDGLDPVEHATYTLLANLLLNLDEAITKE